MQKLTPCFNRPHPVNQPATKLVAVAGYYNVYHQMVLHKLARCRQRMTLSTILHVVAVAVLKIVTNPLLGSSYCSHHLILHFRIISISMSYPEMLWVYIPLGTMGYCPDMSEYGSMRYMVSNKMMAKLYTSPFCVPAGGAFVIRRSSGAV